METSVNQIFIKEVNQIKADLIAKHEALGMRSSGKWIENLQALLDVTESNLKSVFRDMAYTEQLVQGREPGKFPPIDSIKQWIIDKPITPTDNISIDSLAFLIARKIANEGTDYYQQGGTELIESVITPERIKKIADKVGVSLLATFELEVNELLIR